MVKHEKLAAQSQWQAVEAAELQQVNGGIWDYSNRLGALGEHLEQWKDRKYGDLFNPKNLDEAAGQALQGWVSVP
jgi:hypothetical protein